MPSCFGLLNQPPTPLITLRIITIAFFVVSHLHSSAAKEQPLRWVTSMPQGAMFSSPKQDGMSIKCAQLSFVFSQCIKLQPILMSEMQVHTTKRKIYMQILTP